MQKSLAKQSHAKKFPPKSDDRYYHQLHGNCTACGKHFVLVEDDAIYFVGEKAFHARCRPKVVPDTEIPEIVAPMVIKDLCSKRSASRWAGTTFIPPLIRPAEEIFNLVSFLSCKINLSRSMVAIRESNLSLTSSRK